MEYNFDRIVERTGTSCNKYDKRAEVFGEESVLPMWIADMDFEVAPCITEAIKQRAEHPVYGYEFRSDEYHDAIISWIKRRNGWDVRREWLEYTPGVVSGLVFSMRALTREGDGVVIQPPVYPPFSHVIVSNSRKLLNNPMKLSPIHGFEIDFEDLNEKLSKARAIMFCNPHNPTGRVFTEKELIKLGELCLKHNVWIISDEIHSDLLRKPHKHIHIASIYPELAERTITLLAPSKSFNIAGLNTSVAIVPGERMMRAFRAELERTHVSAGNCFGSVALTAAYNGCDQWMDEVMEYIGGNVDFVKEFIAKYIPSIKAHHYGGTYLMWLDFNRWGMKCEELFNFLVYEAGLGLNRGSVFGEEGRGFARMNVATSREMVEKAMMQLYEASKQLKL